MIDIVGYIAIITIGSMIGTIVFMFLDYLVDRQRDRFYKGVLDSVGWNKNKGYHNKKEIDLERGST